MNQGSGRPRSSDPLQDRLRQLNVIRLSIPNPFFEGRNQIYVITTDPVTMIDTGIATQKAFDALVQGLDENGLSITDIQRVILTHKHVDHIGNAWRIQQQSSCEVMIHEQEMHAIHDVDPDGKKFVQLVRHRLDDWEVPNDARPKESTSSRWKWEIESSEPTGLRDGQRLSQGDGQLEIVHTPGHTMGSICIKYAACLFSGDHVLPDISPNVGGGDMRHEGMLRNYLVSLDRVVESADQNVIVSPGHGNPFVGLHARYIELVEHHHQRLNNVINILRRDREKTVYEVANHLFGDMQDFHIILGCAEAAAHLEYLEHEGRVASEDGGYQLA